MKSIKKPVARLKSKEKHIGINIKEKKRKEKPEKRFTVNGYTIVFSNFWGNYSVSHKEIGADIAQFKFKKDAIKYAKNG